MYQRLLDSAVACALAASALGAPASPLGAFEIAPGVLMPAVNLGHPDDTAGRTADETKSAELWLSLGGVGIDTAFDYQNQKQVGAALIGSGRNRTSVFVTSKISPTFCTAAAALAAVKVDIAQIGSIKQLDLVLHHFPCKTAAENAAIWSGLLNAKKLGLARAVGVSNYKVADLAALAKASSVAPSVNQCSMAVGNVDHETIAYCQAHNITYESYSPLRRVDLSDATLVSIGARHNASSAQVALRWINQQGIPIATSPGVNAEYCKEDLDLGAFTLSQAEMGIINKLE